MEVSDAVTPEVSETGLTGAQSPKVWDELRLEIGKRLIGQEEVETALLVSLLTGGHVLLEGLPGLAKTTAVLALGEATHLEVRRIQFTPDLLPADVVGTQIFNPKTSEFIVRKGPVFSNLVVADEINRAPAKVQSALLEAMQERQVSIGGETFKLPDPFLVLATQNPIEQSGTYPLPEAQLDRFLFKVNVGYISAEDEFNMISQMSNSKQSQALNLAMNQEQLQKSRVEFANVHVASEIFDYIVRLVGATRPNTENADAETTRYVEVGASPRASLALEKVARAVAFLGGRDYVTPSDVQALAKLVLRHRLILNYEAEAENLTADDLIEKLIEKIPTTQSRH